MAVLALGSVGTFVELLLLGHYEEGWQLAPLVLIGAAIVCLAWLARSQSARSVRAVRLVMALFVVAGFAGMGLHLRGAAEFQWEMDASQPRWGVFTKAIQAKAPPALAPGVMIHLGLMGLIGVYRHPAETGSLT